MFKQINKQLKFGTILIVTIILTLGFSVSLQSLLAAWIAPESVPPMGNLNDFTINGSISAGTNAGVVGKVGIGTPITSTAKMTMKASNNEEGLRIISSNNSPLVIRNNTDSADLFRVDQSGTLISGTVPWTRLTGVPSIGAGTVTSIATNNGLTGGTITTTGTIGLNTTSLSTGTAATGKVYWDGTKLVSGTDQTGTGGITGSGNNNYLTKWTTAGSVIGNSLIQDNGTQVGIGVAPSTSFALNTNMDIAINGIDIARRDGTNAYLYPWGTGYTGNKVYLGGGAVTNLQVTGDVCTNAGKCLNTAAIANITSPGASGYTKLSDGLILQWITYPSPGCAGVASTFTLSFPIAFPNNVLFVQGREYGTAAGNGSLYRETSWTKTTVTLARDYYSTACATFSGVKVFAIGN